MPHPTMSRRRVGAVLAAGVAAIAIVWAAGAYLTRHTWHRAGGPLQVAGWVPYWQTADGFASFDGHVRLFSDVGVSAWQATGASTIESYRQFPADAMTRFTTRGAAAAVPVFATVIDGTPAGTMAAILADPAQRAAHVSALVQLAVDQHVGGIDVDYEGFAFRDGRGTWATTRPLFTAFVTELAAALHARGLQLVIDVPPVYDDGSPTDRGYWVYDQRELGKVVDRIRVMAYDYSSSAGPMAPLAWVRGLVEAEAKLVPPAKLDLGIAVYGYDWLTVTSGTCPASIPSRRQPLSLRAIDDLLAARQATAVHDDVTGEARFTYTDTQTGPDDAGTTVTCTLDHDLRWIDGPGVAARVELAWRHDFHGVALWALGDEVAATWDAIAANRDGPRTTSPPTTVTPSTP